MNTENMKTGIKKLLLVSVVSLLLFAGCGKEGPQGPAGQDATVYYSEWFTPSVWSGNSGDWYFEVNAPDLTEDIVENGVVMAYAWLDGDVYEGTAVRPLPAHAIGANWSFLIHQYESIQFTCDMFNMPLASGNKFRFIAIPGNIPALKSGTPGVRSTEELKSLSYVEICRLYNIPL